MRRLLTLTIALTLAGAAQAAPQTSGLALQREEVVALDSRRTDFAGQRVRLEVELDGLSTEIAALKSKSGSLLGGGSLDGKLVRSREISAQIDALRAEEGQVAHKLERKAEALLTAYDAEVETVRASLESAEGEARQQALSSLARLENERREVRAGLGRLSPDAYGHKLERTASLAHKLERNASLSHKLEREDPDSLRAAADRLRDTRDRLLRRIKQLQRRADELRAQAELDAEMRSFHAETSLFDETDFSVVRMTATAGGSKRGAAELSTTSDVSNDSDGILAGAVGGGGAQDGEDPSGSPGGDFNAPPAPEGRSGESTSITAAGYDETEAFFQLGREASRSESLEAAGAMLLGDEAEGSADVLKDRQAAMKRLADRLESRAKSLDSEASNLDR